MTRERVSYRLSVDGDRDVLDTLARIGEAGEGSAKRMARAYVRDLGNAEAQLERLERRQKAMLAMGVSPTQMQVNSVTGITDAELGRMKSAEESMRTFISEQDRLIDQRNRMLGQFDPLFAAQQRYNLVVEEADRLHQRGVLNEEELTRVRDRAKDALDRETEAHRRGIASVRQQANGYRMLGYQVQDVSQQVLLGVNPLVILAQQGGQTAMALEQTLGSAGTAGRIATFISGPWGSLLLAGATALGMLAMRAWEAEDALDAVEASTYRMSEAQSILGSVIDLQTGKIRQQTGALHDLALAQAIAGQVGARSRAAEAQSGLNEAATERGERVRGPWGLPLFQVRGGPRPGIEGFLRAPAPSATVVQNFLDQNIDAGQAINELQRLADAGELTDQRLSDLSLTIANLGVERTNEEVFTELRAALEGDQDAVAGFLNERPRPSGGGGGGRSAADDRDALAEAMRANAQSARDLLEAYDPLLRAENERADQLAEIARLEQAGPDAGGLTAGQAAGLRAMVQQDYEGNRAEAFASMFPDLAAASEQQQRDRETSRQNRERFVGNTSEDQARRNALLDVELGLVRATEEERARAVALRELQLDLQRAGIALESAEAQQILQTEEALQDKLDTLAEMDRNWQALERVGQQALDTLLDTRRWDDWGELGKKIIQDLIQEMLILSAINPLKNELFGTSLPTADLKEGILGFIGSIFGSAPGNAMGDAYSSGGWRRVGEFGAELVRLPRGAQVHNAGQTRALTAANATMRAAPVITINADGADAEQLRRVEDAVRELNDNLENRAVEAVSDANQRSYGALLAV